MQWEAAGGLRTGTDRPHLVKERGWWPAGWRTLTEERMMAGRTGALSELGIGLTGRKTQKHGRK